MPSAAKCAFRLAHRSAASSAQCDIGLQNRLLALHAECHRIGAQPVCITRLHAIRLQSERRNRHIRNTKTFAQPLLQRVGVERFSPRPRQQHFNCGHAKISAGIGGQLLRQKQIGMTTCIFSCATQPACPALARSSPGPRLAKLSRLKVIMPPASSCQVKPLVQSGCA
jgi:hypothetical protein